MSSGQLKRKLPMAKVIIKNGKIVRMNKNGTIKSILGPYPPEKNK